MMDWIIGLLILAGYVLSVLWCRRELKISNGTILEPTILDVIFTLIPFVNIGLAFLFAAENGLWKKAAKKYFGK